MKHLGLLMASASLGYASAPKPKADSAATDKLTQTTDTATVADAPKPTKERVAPEVTSIATIDMPKPVRGGGTASAYAFDKLEVGQAFGVKNKGKREIASAVTNANRKYRNEMKNEAGEVLSTVQERHFFSHEVDTEYAKTLVGTPLEGSTVLVFRDQ